MDNKNNENFEAMIDNAESRFSFGPSDVELVTEDNRLISGNDIDDYVKEHSKNIKIDRILSVGDVVKISYIDVPLTIVESKNQNGAHLFGSDYGGKIAEDPTQLILFEQDEIEEVIKEAKDR